MSSPKRRPRRGRPGSLDDLKRELWGALRAAAALLDSEHADVRLRAAHAVSQCSATYRALLADAETDQRLTELEKIAGERRP
jgi:hypothetical protein